MTFNEMARQRYSALIAQARDGEKLFREKAWGEFERLGWPGLKTETWKYSSPAALSSTAWIETQAVPGAPAAEVLAAIRKWSADFDVAVLENGKPLSDPAGRLRPVRLSPGDDLNYEDGFLGLAAAVHQGGYEIRLEPGGSIQRPLLIIRYQRGTESWVPTVNRIDIPSGGNLKLMELFLGEGGSYLRSDLNLVHVGEAGRLEWVRVQQEDLAATHFSEVQAHLQRDARLSVTQLNGGALWSRQSFKADIHGTGAEARVNGLSFAREKQHVDQRVKVAHFAGHSESSQLFKGVLKDQARGVLNGKIYIAQDAQKVNSSQLNQNLLLSTTAEADTKPELEVYADDVKANHGASIGRLDEDKLFYLLSRGIPRTEAVHILARAFVADVVMRIEDRGLRGFAEARMEEILPAFAQDMEADA